MAPRVLKGRLVLWRLMLVSEGHRFVGKSNSINRKISRQIPHFLAQHLPNLRPFAIPHTLEIQIQHSIQILRAHFHNRIYLPRNTSRIETDINSSILSHRLRNRVLDLGFLGAVRTYR